MRSKQNILFPWDEFNQQRLYVTFESYEDFEDFVTFLAKKRNHYWAKQKRKGLRELWDNLNMYLYHFAITANAVKPLSIIDKQVKPYGRYFYTYREMLMAKILVQSGYDHFDKLENKKSNGDTDHIWGKLVKDKPYAHEEVIFPIDVMEGIFKDNAPSIINFHSLIEYLNERDGIVNNAKPSPVLDDVEREWIKDFTSLFKNVVFVSVTKHIEKALNGEYSYLIFSYDENGERRRLFLPSFKTADMYKGMVNGHVYDFDKLMENKG